MRSAHFLCGLLAVAGLAGSLPAAAQYAPWTTRHLDAEASVQMPTEGTEDADPQSNGRTWRAAILYGLVGNSFEIFRVDSQTMFPQAEPGTYQFNVGKFLAQYFKDPNQPFHRAKLLHEYLVKVPTAPDGTVFHRVYHGFDEQTQAAAVLKTTCVYRNGILCLFNCHNSLLEDPGSSEDKLYFFSSIHFEQP